MSIYRSYFKKNSTLVDNVLSNNSRNPVTEISYGTESKQVSRFLFDVDLSNLQMKYSDGTINPTNVTKHVLHLTNTIRYAPELIGGKSYLSTIDRASSFDLELFNVNEDWDEGAGYTFVYNDLTYPQQPSHASNWYERKTNLPWSVNGGAYLSGLTTIIGTQSFDNGNENFEIDVTNYINQRIAGSGTTYTGTSYGLGIKFGDQYEATTTEFRQAVAFHAKGTNTYYEPYIETTIGDEVIDDRNFFYLDKDNSLYLYVGVGNNSQNIVVNQVVIYDYENNEVAVLTGNSITNVTKGIYKISINVDSETYPDAVIFKDEWTVTINGRESKFTNKFYLISQDRYYTFDLSNQINTKNYYFTFWGIGEGEKISSGIVRKVKILMRELYPNQNNNLPLDIEYRLFTTVGGKYEIDVIPFTKANRTSKGYEFNLDTSWLIPQDYKLQIRMSNGDSYETKETLSFTVISNGLIKTSN